MDVISHSYHATSAAEGFSSISWCGCFQQCSQAHNCQHFPQPVFGATLTLEHPIITVTGCHLFCWVVVKCQKSEAYLIWACQRADVKERREKKRGQWRAADSETVFSWDNDGKWMITLILEAGLFCFCFCVHLNELRPAWNAKVCGLEHKNQFFSQNQFLWVATCKSIKPSKFWYFS